VKLFETPCDVDRVKEWAVGVVRQDVSAKNDTINVCNSII